jgi:hypothetical protein
MDAGGVGDERALEVFRRYCEADVVLGQVNLAQEAVGDRDRGDAGELELLGQPVLERAERTLGATPRLGRVGRDVLDAELGKRPADLGELIPGDLLSGLGGDEVVARAVGIERARQPCAAITSASARKVLMVPSSSTRNAE